TILKQICNQIPRNLVPTLARKHGVDKKARDFSPWSHVVSLIHAQLAHSLSLNDVARLKPSMIANIYIVAYYQQLFPNDDDWQLDSFFQQVADRQGKKVVGLETIEDQIKLIYESQSIERQAFLLVGTLRGKDRITEELHELNAYYKKGNLVPLLQTYLNDSSEFAPTAQEKFLMLDARNLEWTKKLPDLLHKNSCFVAVGALHLVGENGLINLLRQKGYRVSKVK
ncbi:MAG TPA: TraB/GumN family protein, partial [Paludibacteraceae bacterium]|nr:TraB/GumN family protein [Paludibacteraceae bacterium]